MKSAKPHDRFNYEPPPLEETSQGCAQILQWAKRNLDRDEVGTANRASSAPSCILKRWYKNQGVVGEPMQPRALLVFAFGDLVEHMLKYLIAKACVGRGKLYSEVDFGKKVGSFTVGGREFDIFEQEKLVYKIGSVRVSAHPDGWGKRNSDGRWEVIEIKSASDYGYDLFVGGADEYINQPAAIMLSPRAKKLKVAGVRFFFARKETSHIHDRFVPRSKAIERQVIAEYRAAAARKKPKRPYDPVPEMTGRSPNKRPTGREKLQYPCSYCEYKGRCFANLKMEFQGSKPVWVVSDGRKSRKTG